ncbi:MAG: triose-phosphate isomerase [Acidobacteriota bacterium]|nr:triose-phosphate isomerase [Acidobacteriota bacterium]
MQSKRFPVIAGNWKMHKSIREAEAFIAGLSPKVKGATHCEVIVAPSFTALQHVAKAADGSNIRIAGQDVAWEKEGAFTGDVSAPQLADAGATHVIVGHSERRKFHGETDERVNAKLKAALSGGLTPIVCVGETLEERESELTEEVLTRQFTGGFAGLTPLEFSHIIIAYEPVWAIGTGRTATPEIAGQSHSFLRSLAEKAFGTSASESVRILYGGSVKPDNIRALMDQDEIDGALVGGASIKVDSFAAIVGYPGA